MNVRVEKPDENEVWGPDIPVDKNDLTVSLAAAGYRRTGKFGVPPIGTAALHPDQDRIVVRTCYTGPDIAKIAEGDEQIMALGKFMLEATEAIADEAYAAEGFELLERIPQAEGGVR